MKTLVILTVLFVYAQALERPPEKEQILEQCATENNVDKDEIKERFKDVVPEDNPQYIAFATCYCKKAGSILEDGSLNKPLIKDFLPRKIRTIYTGKEDPDKIANEVYELCTKIQTDTPGLTCIKYRNCVLEYVKNKNQESSSH